MCFGRPNQASYTASVCGVFPAALCFSSTARVAPQPWKRRKRHKQEKLVANDMFVRGHSKGFRNANALSTILTLISAITLSFQIITAKIVAQQGEGARRDTVYRTLHRGSWVCGLLVALLLLVFQSQITTYLDLPGTNLVTI